MSAPSVPARRSLGGRLAFALCALCVAIAAAYGLELREQPNEHVTLTAGFADTTRNLVARALAKELSAHGIATEVVTAAETADELARVDSREIDMALVSAAFRERSYSHVREVGPLHVEALHVLVKRELAGRVGPTLAGARGRSVSLGPRGSAGAGLAAAVLSFAGLTAEGTDPDLVAEHLAVPELEARLDKGERTALPDIVFDLATVPSKLALRLVREADYRLVPLPFAEAFRVGALFQEHELPGEAGTIDRTQAAEAMIPPFTYQSDPPVPPEASPTLGARLLLVAHEDVSSATVEHVLDVVYGSAFSHRVHPPLERGSLALAPRLPRHPGAQRFLARERPLLTEGDMDKLSNSLSVAGALLGAGLFLWQGWRQRRSRLRERVFASYVLRTAEIERRTVALELSASLELEPLIALQRELLQLKGEALERFAAGELGGERMLSDLLAPLDAARDHVGSLLLHVRDNLEDRAEAQGRAAGTVWSEAAKGSGSRGS